MSEEGCVDVRRERQRSWSSEECSSSNNNRKRLSKAHRFHEGLDGIRVRLGGMQVIRGSHEDQGNYSKVEASGSNSGQGTRREHDRTGRDLGGWSQGGGQCMDESSGQGLVEEMEIAYRRKACARMICFALPWERLGPDSRGRAVVSMQRIQ
jgi:hypothetical protein